ncbi:MAG TPA: glycosyltransferase, partial [Tepidisphaeraceae bacterium]
MPLRPRYLVLTHVAAATVAGDLLLPDAFATALQVQVVALQHAGFDVALAVPVGKARKAPGNHTIVRPAEIGVRAVALPAYRTMAQYLARRAALRRTVAAAAGEADVVQAGLGGYPMAMAEATWDALGRTTAKRLLLFGEDPFPARAGHAANGRNPAKRYGKSLALQRLGRFCQSAIGEAAATIAHSPAVAARFAAEWHDRCHVLPPGLIRDSDLIGRKLMPPSRVLRVACVGREQAVAGVDHVLEAIAQARRLSAEIELDLVGDITGSAPLMNLLRELGLEPIVRLHGHLSDARLCEILDSADVFVSPTLVPIVDRLIYRAAARG